ncbi:peptide deformylase 1A, chloroplastic/mitochondrial-like isoform X2 [Tripterygium wilfordii]|uniref:peptide deformylase 1A, chloroplastic/mitochondrial-like isoform X2 n=1 Tax=Tripterygium wilfordii TaxID=458696 RepID=UPI0018F7F1CB|nr:peptide deformylase 1A, chloroplastic/mitochondrial-like isoform X2 [Tripterygium wilfordii]
METLLRFSFCLRQISAAKFCRKTTTINSVYRPTSTMFSKPEFLIPSPSFTLNSATRRKHSSSSTTTAYLLTDFGSAASGVGVGMCVGLILGLPGLNENKKPSLPEIVKAGDPVLHEPAREVNLEEIVSERIQKIIDDMIKIIVLEDTEEFISHDPKEETNEQDRRPFDLMVIVNPKLKKKSNKTALFFEGCLSVRGFGAVVERYLEVEVTGFNRDGRPIKVDAKGWQARILQHECDHLDGTLYVDKMVPRTFRSLDKWYLPLAKGCPKLGVRWSVGADLLCLWKFEDPSLESILTMMIKSIQLFLILIQITKVRLRCLSSSYLH